MDRIEFLVEEASVAEVLKLILPQIMPDPWVLDENYFIRPHEGKSDLKKSIPNKIKAYRKGPSVGIVVLQDLDSNDCKQLKTELVSLCAQNANENTPFLVRIVCHELEAWYMGDTKALSMVFPRFKPQKYKNKNHFRNPDNCVNPKNLLKSILGVYPQIQKAREMGAKMDVNNNLSESFNQFIQGILRFISQNDKKPINEIGIN